MFDEYLERWRLTPDGEPIARRGSGLLPVRHGRRRAFLKVAVADEEKVGGRLMCWWDGAGAAAVLAHDGEALLLERAEGPASLAELARNGRDDEASRLICGVLARLHAPRPDPPSGLPTLDAWFEPLQSAARAQGGILRRSAAVAAGLLASPADVRVLHGDVHHGNILDFGARGWLAIDPKGLVGERAFDFANLFCNPDRPTALAPGRLMRQIDVVADAAGLDPTRLLEWIVAWAGLSAAFDLQDGLAPGMTLAIAERAAAKLAP
jgi:streptomycin 6-kinase